MGNPAMSTTSRPGCVLDSVQDVGTPAIDLEGIVPDSKDSGFDIGVAVSNGFGREYEDPGQRKRERAIYSTKSHRPWKSYHVSFLAKVLVWGSSRIPPFLGSSGAAVGAGVGAGSVGLVLQGGLDGVADRIACHCNPHPSPCIEDTGQVLPSQKPSVMVPSQQPIGSLGLRTQTPSTSLKNCAWHWAGGTNSSRCIRNQNIPEDYSTGPSVGSWFGLDRHSELEVVRNRADRYCGPQPSMRGGNTGAKFARRARHSIRFARMDSANKRQSRP